MLALHCNLGHQPLHVTPVCHAVMFLHVACLMQVACRWYPPPVCGGLHVPVRGAGSTAKYGASVCDLSACAVRLQAVGWSWSRGHTQ